VRQDSLAWQQEAVVGHQCAFSGGGRSGNKVGDEQ